MKIRNGFVSNSSSSSFIISDKHFENVRSLATYMIKKKIEDDMYYTEELEEDNYNNKYIKNLKFVDENAPVSFPSCNYDTFIKKVGDCYLVSTCNNTDWDLYDYSTKLTDIAKEKLIELRNNFSDNSYEQHIIEDILNGDYDFSSFDDDYYSLQNNVIGVELYEHCPICKKDMWKTKKFGTICLDCNPLHKRKDKLTEINNNNNEN